VENPHLLQNSLLLPQHQHQHLRCLHALLHTIRVERLIFPAQRLIYPVDLKKLTG
jgi:hypothetical protein